jgi:CrcB protein
MNQLIGIALGGAFGSVLRFLVSTGVYQWLGRGFPYGTLAVNLIGSFLIGFLTEVLVLQRITFGTEYRAAILVGVLGGFTTFSTFSLESIYLIEQGNLSKAGLNVLISVGICLLATWLGLLTGRTLFLYSGGVLRWMGWLFPYALVAANALVSFLIGLVTAVLLHKVALSIEYRAAILLVVIGAFATLSGLYVVLYLIEQGHSFDKNINTMLLVFMVNASICGLTLWLGLLAGKQV